MPAVPPWLAVMASIDGTHEVSGSGDNPTILGWATYIGQQYPEMASYCAGYTHDSIAWCGLTVAYCLAKSGIRPQFGATDTDRFLWADSWRQFGAPVAKGAEQPGDVLVFKWASGGHHVTLYEGKSGSNYTVHGGNQSDAVNTQHYAQAYCTGIRRPAVVVTQPQPQPQPAPVPAHLPPAGSLPPIVQLAEEAAALVIKQLIAADPAAIQRAGDIRAKLLRAREVADIGLALLDKVAPAGRPPVPSPDKDEPVPPWLKLPPAPAPAPTKPAPAPLAHFVGKCSWFGGPDDTGVSPSEGLAFISSYSQAPNLFLPQQPPGTTGLARRLDPEVYYIACRWDYHLTPATMLRDQSVQATVRANGRELLAHPADWGPNEKTGRVADLSHGLMTALGISTDDQVEVVYPATQGATQMPAADDDQVFTSKKRWYQSTGIWGAIIAAIAPFLGGALHITLSGEQASQLAQAMAQVGNGIAVFGPLLGGALAGVGRVKARTIIGK